MAQGHSGEARWGERHKQMQMEDKCGKVSKRAREGTGKVHSGDRYEESARGRERERERELCVCVYIYIYIYTRTKAVYHLYLCPFFPDDVVCVHSKSTSKTTFRPRKKKTWSRSKLIPGAPSKVNTKPSLEGQSVFISAICVDREVTVYVDRESSLKLQPKVV